MDSGNLENYILKLTKKETTEINNRKFETLFEKRGSPFPSESTWRFCKAR